MRRANRPLLLGMVLVILLILQCLPARELPGPEGPIVSECVLEDQGPAIEPAKLLAGIKGSFKENLGQVRNPDVRYYAKGDPLTIGFTSDGIVFVLRGNGTQGPYTSTHQSGDAMTIVFRLEFEDSYEVEPRGVEVLQHRSQFFDGNDRDGWVTDVRSFSEVVYEGIYDGVDLRFYFLDKKLKYDFLLDPRADPDAIVLRYEGISGLTVEDGTGDLIISTLGGDLRDSRPVIFQEAEVGREEYPGRFVLLSEFSWGFEIPEECRRELPMIIDPGLEFCTYFGGTYGDRGNSIVTDDEGMVYIAGTTSSRDFPTSPGAYDDTKEGCCDAFVAKILPPELGYFSTYLGGNLHDGAVGLEVLPDGTIWVLGETDGNFLFPYVDSYRDPFLVKLDNNGSWIMGFRIRMAYYDHPTSFHVDESGDFVIAGYTNSPNMMTHEEAYCRTYTGSFVPWSAAFIFKGCGFPPDEKYATYLNGISIGLFSLQPVIDVDVDSDGNIFIAGTTRSSDFPSTHDAYCTTYKGGETDGFVVKFDPKLNRIIDSTLLGGDQLDGVHSVAIGKEGSVYLTGFTNSTDFPLSPNAFCASSPGKSDAFITVLDNDLSRLVFSTLLGSEGYDAAATLDLGPKGDTVCLLGTAQGNNLTCTEGCFDPIKRGTSDLFIAVINITGERLDYCTY
jgi:hypothetical protein